MNLENLSKSYHSSHSLVYSCQYHIVFCPKYRRKVLVGEVADRLKVLLLEKQKEYEYSILGMEVMPDHVHLLLDANPQVGIINIIAKIKGYTARILRSEFPRLKGKIPCMWTRSKFVSTVGSVSLEVVKQYIENQKNV